MICAATVASAPGALAAPITTIGFAVNGTCEAGTCPATPLAVGGSASLPFTFDTTVNGDDFQITGTPGSSNPNGANFGAGTPFSIQYLGDGTGGASQADTLTANAYRAYTSNVTSVGVTALQSVGFSSAIAAGSTAQTSVALNGTNVAAFGPFSSSTAKSFSQVQSYSLGISTGTLTQDNTYTTTFAAGSPVGSYVTYGTQPAPTPVTPMPSTPTCSQLLTGAVAPPALTVPSLSSLPTHIAATFQPSYGGVTYTLAQTASACGVAGFDWQQTILSIPYPSPIFSVSTGAAVTAPPLVSDPISGGLTYCNTPTFNCTNSYPFYYSVSDPATNALSVAAHLNGISLSDSTTLSFADTPNNPCVTTDNSLLDTLKSINFCGGAFPLAPEGAAFEFFTTLVGVSLSSPDALVPLPALNNFSWNDSFDGNYGGITVSDDTGQGQGTGGITLLDFDGAPLAVPEPSSFIMLVTWLGIVCLVLKAKVPRRILNANGLSQEPAS